MNFLIITLAIVALPAVFLTMYSRTARGMNVPMGSFFIIRKFSSDFLKVRSLKNILLLFFRLSFVALIVLLIFDPTDVEMPGRDVFFHNTTHESSQKQDSKYLFNLIAPPQVMDRFNEDLFFIEAFVKSNSAGSRKISVLYNPTEEIIDKTKNDIIIFPSRKQGRSAFLKWIELLEFSSLQMDGSKIRNTDIQINIYYPILIFNNIKVKKYAELENGSVIAVSFEHEGRKILLFGIGLSSFWGDAGLSGYFIDIIESFKSDTLLSTSLDLHRNNNESAPAGVKSILSFDVIIKIASLIFLIELVVFVIKNIRVRKTLVIIFLLFFASGLLADDYKFIELSLDGKSSKKSKQMFSIIKHELEQKTTIRLSNNFYKTRSANSLIKGNMPEFPFLWFIGCKNKNKLTDQLANALLNFIKKGGVLFVDLQNKSNDSICFQFFNELGMKISGHSGVTYLPKDHPVYKSFYLLNAESFSGINASISTKRTALIISIDNLKRRILNHDNNAIKAGINIVLYMLSGNYKSDQIHTRQILKRLKKRELFR